jgi:predicted MFS family arabinose efflux permease
LICWIGFQARNRPNTSSMKKGHVFALVVLLVINTLNFFDRQILGALAEPIRKEWALSDTALGMLGTAFTLLYAVVGLPLGRLTDTMLRNRLLAAGVFVWSLLTAATALAGNFWQLFLLRLGVGVGEATCAPAATSLIGDLYPARHRSRAISIFMLGLPIGIGLSFYLSSMLAHAFGWRKAFVFAGIPGIICAVAALLIREPPRGASETHAIGQRRRPGSPYWVALSTPTMLWLILSGALHNFNTYAMLSFMSPYLMRFHGADIRQAGTVAMLAYGLSGIPGLILGGMASDAMLRRRPDGRLWLGALSILVSAPLIYLALSQPRGSLTLFVILMACGSALSFTYYSAVYPTIHDVTEPALRGTAMALYFLAMYVVGASLGPVGTGFASDYFTRKAATAAGVTQFTAQTLEPFRAEGLRSAMMIIPLLLVGLAIVLYAGSRTVAKDAARLQDWARESSA